MSRKVLTFFSASSWVSKRQCPSCQRNSAPRKNGRVVFSQRTTEHHWLYIFGRSRYEDTNRLYISEKRISEVGRMIRGSANFWPPPTVATRHSGAKPSMCSFSLLKREAGITLGR